MTDVQPGSLAHRVAQRRKEREARRGTIVTVPVPGFEDLFAVNYRRLTLEERSEIVDRNDVLEGGAGSMTTGAADLLINACVDILEITGQDEAGEPIYLPLGKKWTPSVIAELFEEDTQGVTVRDALMQVLDSDDLTGHFAAYSKAVRALDEKATDETPGESGPSDEG